MWKLIYGLKIMKEGEEDPFEGRNDDEEEEENDVEKEKQEGDKATAKEQQQEQSVHTQLPPPSPPHATPTPADSIAIKNFLDTSSQNINPLTIEDLKKILHQKTLQSQLCTNPILVSVDELQKAVAEITKDKVNPKEPPSQNPTATSDQPKEKSPQDTSTKVDILVTVTSIVEEPTKEQTR
jgi:hypothetical protein